MSKNLERVIQRAISDAAFRRQLQSNPEAALRGFKLTDLEVAALRSGDASKLTSLGIDQRMSKTFSFGGDSLASRAAIGGDLTTGSGASFSERDARLNNEVAGGRNEALDPENASGTTRVIPGSASGSTPAFDPGTVSGSTSVGDPMAEGITTSRFGDPDNAGHARGYTGGQTAPTSDAMEDQSHAFAATRSADVAASGQAAPIEGSPEEFAFRDQGASAARGSVMADPDNPANARGYIGGEASSAATASSTGDPDNPASARTYTGGQGASGSDAIEDQSHAFAATRSADVAATGQAAPIAGSPEEFAFRDQGATASSLADPDNAAVARGYIGEQTAPTSDAIEDQSHAIAANRSDAFLSEGEVSQYSDPNLTSAQARDEGELFNPNAADTTIPDDTDTVSVRHDPDIPT
jgi:hypothetical protein